MPDSGVKVVTRQLSGNRTDHEENSAKVWALLPSFKKGDSEGDRVLPPPSVDPPAPSPPASQRALPSGVPAGDGDGRGTRLHGGWALYSGRCRFASFYLPATAVGLSSRVRPLLRFSDGGGGFDTISGEGSRSLLLLLVFSVEDVDGAIPGEQDVRLAFLFPQIISGVCAFVGDGSVGSVFPFRFAFGWNLFFSGSSSSLESTADWGTGKLSSLMVVLASSIPCHLWTGSADGRSVFVRESTRAVVRMRLVDLGPGLLFLILSSSVDDAMCGGGRCRSFGRRKRKLSCVCCLFFPLSSGVFL